MAKKTSKIDAVKTAAVKIRRLNTRQRADAPQKDLDDARRELEAEIKARRTAESHQEELRQLLGIERTAKIKALNDLAYAQADIERRDNTNKRVLNAGQQLADKIAVLDDVIINLRNQNADLVRALVKLALKIV